MAENAAGDAPVGDSYSRGLHTRAPFPLKMEVRGMMVAVGETRREDRGLKLIVPFTRVVHRDEVHELQLTDDEDARPGYTVQRVANVGFFVVENSGVLAFEDEVWVGDRKVGKVIGFDTTHYPNHMNVFAKTEDRRTGMEMGVQLGESIRFVSRR